MTIAIKRSTLLVDAALLACACLIPAASHLFALPLYQLDPMRWLLMVSLLVGARQGIMKSNGILMAILLPLISCVLVGMPTFTKGLLMVAELTTNVLLFSLLASKAQGWAKTFGAMVLSILGAKLVYYVLKALVVSLGIASMPILGTGIALQAVVMIAISAMVALVLNKR